jgi:predicted transcriptional regulator
MKTTFDIPESLLRDVQKLARDRQTTAKSLVEEALRALLDEWRRTTPAFELRDASFKGGGRVTPEFENATPAQLRDAAYGLHS